MIKQVSFVLAALIAASNAIKQTTSTYNNYETQGSIFNKVDESTNTKTQKESKIQETYDKTLQNTGQAGYIVSGADLDSISDPAENLKQYGLMVVELVENTESVFQKWNANIQSYLTSEASQIQSYIVQELEFTYGALPLTCKDGKICRDINLQQTTLQVNTIWANAITTIQNAIQATILQTQTAVQESYWNAYDCTESASCSNQCYDQEVTYTNSVTQLKSYEKQIVETYNKWTEYDQQITNFFLQCPQYASDYESWTNAVQLASGFGETYQSTIVNYDEVDETVTWVVGPRIALDYTETQYGSINTGAKDVKLKSDTTSQQNNDAIYSAVSSANANAVYTGVDYQKTNKSTTDQTNSSGTATGSSLYTQDKAGTNATGIFA